jgi:hypothetical protein
MKKSLVFFVVMMILPGLLLLPGENPQKKPKVIKGAKVVTVTGGTRSWKDADKTPLNRRLVPRRLKPVLNFENPRKLKKIGTAPDPVVQTSNGLKREALAMVEPIMNFEGMNFSQHGAGWPPDTCGDVGINHYVQAVNISIGIFNKSTGAMLSATTFDDFFEGPSVAGTPCDENNNGDPIVLYDQYENRWIILDFAWTGTSNGSWFSIAASKTSDPTGDWWLYAFHADPTLMNDYPKLGVWPDGIYVTANMFQFGGSFQHVKVWAFEKPDIYNGRLTAQYVTDNSWEAWSILPANAKGATAPPAGAPNYMYAMDADEYGPPGQDAIHWWKYSVDWGNPGNTTWEGPYTMPTAPFGLTAAGIPQPGTSVTLDSLYGRLMNPANYTNFGTHASVYLCHVCEYNNKRTKRWYEVRINSGTSSIFQQGTYAPDIHHRWMGSIAGDKHGNIAMGYSVASSTLYPSIRYAGRLSTDPLGELSQGEASIVEGSGSQTVYSRWGDYSCMTMDPTDGETYWYTNEYLSSTGVNWKTRIASFKFDSAPPPPEAPTNLTATAVSCNQIDLTWQDNSDNEDGFEVERSLDGISFTVLGTVPADETTFSDNNVVESTTYWYRVRAYNASGYSGYSNVAQATTPACPQAPEAPSGLKGRQISFTSVMLKWVDNSDNEDAFIIYRGSLSVSSVSADFYKAIGKVRPDTTSYVDNTIQPGTLYYYKVSAINRYGESFSRPIKIQTQ